MIRIENPQDCCGCTACSSICVHDAIKMEPDALGFLYPKVDSAKCVECGLCINVCQFNDNYDRSLNLTSPIAYAVRHKDIDEVMKSRSGAAFVAISDYVLNHGGAVYGVGYKDHFRVVHKRATTKEERDEFRGSKYVQSDLIGVFRLVKEDLRGGMTVLFSGTPCQTSGLNAYVGKKLRQNLILVDIVCHGVPAPFIWQDYIKYIERKNHNKILAVNFRNKQKYGWTAHYETFLLDDKREVNSKNYTTLFYKSHILRHSCSNCHYTNLQRPSDLTLADFWGWQNACPDFNTDDKGVSLVLVSTEKGKELFDSIKESVLSFNVPLEKCMQPNLIHPTRLSVDRNKFEKDYIEKGFDFVLKKYSSVSFLIRIKKTLVRIIRSLKR